MAPTSPASSPRGSVSIYASASTSSQQIGSLPQGTVVNVYAVSGGWAYIEWNGNYGFCSVSALEPYSGATATPSPTDGYYVETFTATVVTSDARIYQSASTSSTSASVPMGTNVIVRRVQHRVGVRQPQRHARVHAHLRPEPRQLQHAAERAARAARCSRSRRRCCCWDTSIPTRERATPPTRNRRLDSSRRPAACPRPAWPTRRPSACSSAEMRRGPTCSPGRIPTATAARTSAASS